MNPNVRLALGLAPFLAGVPAQGQDSLYQIRSRDMGIEAFDLTVTETKRTPRTSVLDVPGLHERSAAASRWLMCVYTHLAFLRGFKYWAVVYPEPPGEDLLVGFTDTESEDVSQTLGPEFVKDRMLPPQMPVEWWVSNLCGNLNEPPWARGRAGEAVQAPAIVATRSDTVTFTAVTAGDAHTCGVTGDGAAYCWGTNDRGQLGDGTTTDRSSPVLVAGGVSFAAVSAGDAHSPSNPHLRGHGRRHRLLLGRQSARSARRRGWV